MTRQRTEFWLTFWLTSASVQNPHTRKTLPKSNKLCPWWCDSRLERRAVIVWILSCWTLSRHEWWKIDHAPLITMSISQNQRQNHQYRAADPQSQRRSRQQVSQLWFNRENQTCGKKHHHDGWRQCYTIGHCLQMARLTPGFVVLTLNWNMSGCDVDAVLFAN